MRKIPPNTLKEAFMKDKLEKMKKEEEKNKKENKELIIDRKDKEVKTEIDRIKEGLLEGLDEYQHKAVVYDLDKNVLCNAVAGSGKTHVLTTRVAWLVANGVNPNDIMLLTFTNKAADEMIERAAKRLNRKKIGIKAGTFHSIASKYLRRYAHVLSYSKNFTILDQHDSKDLIGQIRDDILDKHEIKGEDKKAFPKSSSIQWILSNMINKNRKLEDYEDSIGEENLEYVEEILDEYERIKKEAHLMDFDDLIVNFNIVLDEPYVREEIQREVKFVLIDEYQDINHIQDDIIKKISGMERVFAVGDPSQSIYGFRGSNVDYILNFTDDYNAEEINIKRNYRSDKNILKLAEEAINNNQQGKPIEIVPFKDTDYEQVRKDFKTGRSEADFIAGEIRKLLNNGVEPSEIAVLVRSSGMLTYMLEHSIRSLGIKYELRAGMSFFDKVHIRDLMAMLTLLVNPRCIISFQRSVSLLDGVGAKRSFDLYNYFAANQYSFEKALENTENLKAPKKVKEGFERFLSLFLILSYEKSIEDILNTINNTFYIKYLEKKYLGDGSHKRRIEEAENFYKISDEKEIIPFLEDIKLESDNVKDDEEDNDKVIISTMHRAKGLEWDYVFIPFLNMGNFPRSIFNERELEEERRLFYVALTRGKKKLYLTNHSYDEHSGVADPSIFLEEIETILQPERPVNKVEEAGIEILDLDDIKDLFG